MLLLGLAFALLVSTELAMPTAALAATETINCPDLELAVLNVRSETLIDKADMNVKSCVASASEPTYDSGFRLFAYTEGAASGGAPFWVLPGVVIGGKSYRFGIDSSNPVVCTGEGCGSWPRGDYALCYPLNGACHFTATLDVDGYPASISGDVPSGQYKITNIAVSFEPASLPPPPNTAPVFSNVPDNISVNTDAGQPTAVVTFTPPTAEDDVDGTVTPVLTAGLPSGSAFPVGVTTVTYTATDEAENSDTASFTVTVTDAEKPVIGTVTDINVPADPGVTTAAVDLFAAVSDNVDDPDHFTPVFKVGGSTITSGHDFPLGETTVTVDANADTAGNTPLQISFKVTVTDDEKPLFTSFPDNIELSVDYPDTSAIASWTEPEASDNDAEVEVKQTAGPASGAAFPLGVTTVTYEATDTAENTTPRSFTVTVTQREPGSVTFIVNSKASGTFDFTSPEPALTTSVVTSGGTGSSGPLLVRPGSYEFGFTAPSDIGIEAASCTTGGTIDRASRSGSVELTAGSSVTCTITALDSVRDTVAIIGALAEIRSQLILINGPDLQRRLDELIGTRTAGGFSGLGMSYLDPDMPLTFAMNSDASALAFSYSGANGSDPAGEALAEAGLVTDPAAGQQIGQNLDVWLEGKYAKFDATGGNGGFAVLHGGLDYKVSNDLLFGVGAQLDWIGMDTAGGTGHAEGLGYMVGPYITANLSPGLYFDARAAWGQSYNEVSPYDTYTDSTTGERALVTAALGGVTNLDALEIRPEARLSWYREQIAGYTDSLDVDIPSVTVETGTLEFGPTFRLPGEVADGVTFAPFLSLSGIWTFAETNTATVVSGQPGLENADLRGVVEVGVDVATDGGLTISASGSYDGIGTGGGYEAIGGSLSVGQKF